MVVMISFDGVFGFEEARNEGPGRRGQCAAQNHKHPKGRARQAGEGNANQVAAVAPIRNWPSAPMLKVLPGRPRRRNAREQQGAGVVQQVAERAHVFEGGFPQEVKASPGL